MFHLGKFQYTHLFLMRTKGGRMNFHNGGPGS